MTALIQLIHYVHRYIMLSVTETIRDSVVTYEQLLKLIAHVTGCRLFVLASSPTYLPQVCPAVTTQWYVVRVACGSGCS